MGRILPEVRIGEAARRIDRRCKDRMKRWPWRDPDRGDTARSARIGHGGLPIPRPQAILRIAVTEQLRATSLQEFPDSPESAMEARMFRNTFSWFSEGRIIKRGPVRDPNFIGPVRDPGFIGRVRNPGCRGLASGPRCDRRLAKICSM